MRRRPDGAAAAPATPFLELAAIVLVALIGGCVTRDVRTDRVVAGFASERAVADAPVGGFHLFGWSGPPADSMSEARLDEMAGAGFDLVLHGERDPGAMGANRALLERAAARGMSCMVWDGRMDAFPGLDAASERGRAVVDSIVADYRDRPARFGWYLGDEPPPALFPMLAALHAALRCADPGHPGYNNLFGRGVFRTRRGWLRYTRDYVARVAPAVLSNDFYDFTVNGDRGRFVENAAGLAAVARANGLPFWGTVQLVPHGPYRTLTAGEVRWQASVLLAYGARGLGTFCYWTPAPDPKWAWGEAMIARDGTRTAWYDTVAAMNREVRPVGEALARCTWLAAEHAGWTPVGGTSFAGDGLLRAVEGRAMLGHFADTTGRHLLLVANSDSSAARTIVLALARPRVVSRLYPESGWTAGADPVATVMLPLEAGGFALLRFEGRPTAIACGAAPSGAIAPTPGGLRFALSEVGPHAAIEVLDALGRRLWARTLAAGERDASWDDAGAAKAAAAWIRIEDARSVTVIPAPHGGGR